VGLKRPNAFGLHDVHGNVWEWCQDGWSASYAGGPVDGSAREVADETGRVVRGGSWYDLATVCRSAFRAWVSREGGNDRLGLRPARSVERAPGG
jgi:formylglycine-generating enzyme required for sulfatase activity